MANPWESIKIVLIRPYFLICTGLYIVFHTLRLTDFKVPQLLNSYATDLLCLPIILTLCLVGVRWIKKRPDFRLSLGMIVGMTIYYMLFFEVFLPQSSSNYTADWIDCVCYAIGALFYSLIWSNKSKLPQF